MDKTFVCVGFDGNEMFLNIYQIVAAILVGDDLEIRLSDGSTFLAAGESVPKLVSMLAEIAVSLDGEPVLDVAARARAKESKLTLIKGGDAPSENSERKTPQPEE